MPLAPILPKQKIYYIGFMQSDRWYRKIFRFGFSHVFMLLNDGFNWIEYNPTLHFFSIEILPVSPEKDIWKEYFAKIPSLSIIKVEFFEEIQHKNLSWLPTCVSLIKYILGVRLRCITPYGLFKKLLSLDAVTKGKAGIKHIKLLRR